MQFKVMVFMLLVGCGSPPELMMDTSVEAPDDSSWVQEDAGAGVAAPIGW